MGKDATNNQAFINGTNEAGVELTADIVGRRTESYFTMSSLYFLGLDELKRLNTLADISDRKFLAYMSDDQPIEGLLDEIGGIKNRTNPDRKAAILALATIGLGVDRRIKPEEVRPSIDKWLSP